jgi:hypothetical protein
MESKPLGLERVPKPKGLDSSVTTFECYPELNHAIFLNRFLLRQW